MLRTALLALLVLSAAPAAGLIVRARPLLMTDVDAAASIAAAALDLAEELRSGRGPVA